MAAPRGAPGPSRRFSAQIRHEIAARLALGELSGLDLLELFAFVHPAQFAVPTPAGLARTLGLGIPADGPAAACFLIDAAGRVRYYFINKRDW